MLFSLERELFLGCTEWGGWGWGAGGWGWGLQSGAASAAEIAAPCGCGREQLAVGPQPIRAPLCSPPKAAERLWKLERFFQGFLEGS